MPNLNHKGPEGDGPMTGQKMGKCTNFGQNMPKKDSGTQTAVRGEGQQNCREGQGRGCGNGRGKGMGMGRRKHLHNSES